MSEGGMREERGGPREEEQPRPPPRRDHAPRSHRLRPPTLDDPPTTPHTCHDLRFHGPEDTLRIARWPHPPHRPHTTTGRTPRRECGPSHTYEYAAVETPSEPR
ncbi:hypothetical protein GCM10010372_43430 [Streptomyces tauricus]|nr:hypothetical protein GCM10010372_43430 [Streptomyces tauricus]